MRVFSIELRRPQQKAWRCRALVFVVLVSSCAPFSEYQSARMAGAGHIEVTPSYTSVGSSDGFFQDQVGIQGAIGVHELVDIRVRYERVWYEGDGGLPVKVLGFGPKFRLQPGTMALYVPFGCVFGERFTTSESWQVHPTFLTTVAASRWAEVNSSLKFLIPFNSESESLAFAVNIGLGLGPDDLSYMVRPEVGALFNVRGGSPVFQLGLGFSWATSSQTRSDTLETEEEKNKRKKRSPWGVWEDPSVSR